VRDLYEEPRSLKEEVIVLASILRLLTMFNRRIQMEERILLTKDVNSTVNLKTLDIVSSQKKDSKLKADVSNR
jgi:GTP cyclohydrolase I